LTRTSLHQLFADLVEKNYSAAGILDRDITAYVTDLLSDFASIDALYRIRSVAGKPLESIAEMITASDPVWGQAMSFDREWQVRKHIGDFALMFTGIFPESLAARHRQARESLIDYVMAGKESYHIVSQFERMRTSQGGEAPCPVDARPWSRSAPLFAHLSSDFERCMYGLNLLKSEIESFNDPLYFLVRRILN
jgi:hypothetical protein